MLDSPRSLPQALDPISGRVDALRLADFLQLSLGDIAAILERSENEVLANPVDEGIQDCLKMVVFIAAGLLELTGGSKEQMLIWLKAPHPDLDDMKPLDLMLEGELSVVADVVDDMLSGAPA